MNRAILDVLEEHAYPANDLYSHLRQTWPQINHTTRVIKASHAQVVFPTGDVYWLEGLVWYERSGVRGWFWRALGNLFHSDQLYQRGLESETVQQPSYASETVKLDHLGYWGGFALSAGYSGRSDTLCLRWTVGRQNLLTRLDLLTELMDRDFPVRQFEALFGVRVESVVTDVEWPGAIGMKLPDEPLADRLDGWELSDCIREGDEYAVTWLRMSEE